MISTLLGFLPAQKLLRRSQQEHRIPSDPGRRYLISGLGRTLARMSVAAAAFAVAATTALAQVATVGFQHDFTPGGYRGVEDAWLFQAYPNNNKGGEEPINCGAWYGTKMRGLLRFNMTSLANSYSSISAARLKLKVKTVSDQAAPWSNQTFYLYRVSDANRSWSAGTSLDGPQEGAACWNWKGYSSVIDLVTGLPGGTPWAGSTGCGTAGIDYVATPVASVVLSSTLTPGSTVTFNLTDVSHLDSWIANHGNNAGYVLIAPGLEGHSLSAVAFYSSDSQNLADRPKLELDLTGYVAPPSAHITYTLPTAGRVSLNIYNSQGRVVRELKHADPQNAGAQDIQWNMLDGEGNRVADGSYTWKLLQTPSALTAKYIMQLGINTSPDWDSFTGNNEGVRGLAVDASGVYVSGAISEGPHLVVKQDANGARLWTYHPWVEVWQGGVSMAVDNNVLFMMQWNGKTSRFNAGTGEFLGTWDTAYHPDDHGNTPSADRSACYEIAAKASKLIISMPARNVVRWVNPTNGATIRDVAVSSPQGVALDGAGNAYIVSGTQIVKLGPSATSAATLINNSLVKPWRVTVDPTNGDVLVFDAGTSHQVKRFSSTGTFKAAYGRAGGRQQGLYNGADFQMAMSLAAAPDGSFWVTETYSMPRRTAHYGAAGNLIKEFYGAQIYNVDCAVDPTDPTLVWMNAANGGALQLKVDYTNKSWTVRATYAMTTMRFPNGDTIPGPALSRIWGMAEDYVTIKKRNGNTYLCWDTIAPQVQMLDEAGRRLRPMVGGGSINDLPAALKPTTGGYQRFIWTDENGDGQPTASELTFDARNLTSTAWSGGNGHVSNDFVYHLNLYQYSNPPWPTTRPARLAPRGWTASGAPIYNWADLDWSGDSLPSDFQYTAPYSCWADETGNLYGAYNLDITYNINGPGGGNGFWSHRAGDTKLVKWGPDKKLQWAVGRQSRTGGAEQGEMRYLWRITGMTHNCTVSQDVENGLVHVWDHDGLWVGRILDQWADDGIPDEAYTAGSEDWGGDIYTDPATGKVYFYLAAPGGDRVYEVTGWDNWVRQSGTVTIGQPSDSPGLYAQYWDNQDFTGPSITRKDFTVDFDWGGGSPDSTIGVDSFSARWTGQIIPPASQTYTFYTTSDDGVRLWVNGQLVIDNWTPHGPTVNTGTIALQANQRYSIRLEYFEQGGGTVMKLEWSAGTIGRQIVPVSALVSGTGLSATYWDNTNFTGTSKTRVDATVDFDWGGGSPDPTIGVDTFSARWSGKIQPLHSETYTFYTFSDDGVRLWVNGQLVVNNWTDHGPTENSGTIALSGGQIYDITMEYYEAGGGTTARLLWSSPSVAKGIIPQSALYTPVSGTLAGIYEIEPVHAPGMRLDVAGAGNADGVNVQIAGDNNNSAQRWQVSPVENGRVEITPECAPGRRLDVNGSANGDGVNVQIWTDNDSAAQRWQVIEVSPGIFELTPQCAPTRVLDCSGVGTTSGTNVQIWTALGGNNQRWRLIRQ